MNDLIAISETNIGADVVKTVNARDLHSFLEVGRDFTTWLSGRLEQFDFVENVDYTCTTKRGSSNNQALTTIGSLIAGGNKKEFHLTLDTAKELSMVERNAKGKEARKYFIECERVAKSAPRELSRKDLALMVIDAENEIERLGMIVDAQAPKVAALERISQSSHEHNMRDGAKVLQIKPGTMSGWLKSLGWVSKGGGKHWFSIQTAINSGYMTMRENEQELEDGSVKIRPQAMITPKGMAKLAVILSNNPNANNEGNF